MIRLKAKFEWALLIGWGGLRLCHSVDIARYTASKVMVLWQDRNVYYYYYYVTSHYFWTARLNHRSSGMCNKHAVKYSHPLSGVAQQYVPNKNCHLETPASDGNYST